MMITGPEKPDFQSMTLEELMPFWSKLLFMTGIRPMFQRMIEADLAFSDYVVLCSLQVGPMAVAEVAGCLHITHSAASRAVDGLVHAGFVSRVENPDDRRQKQLSLTTVGEGLVVKCERLLADGVRPLRAALNAEEQEQLRSLLARIIEIQFADKDCPLSGQPVDAVAV